MHLQAATSSTDYHHCPTPHLLARPTTPPSSHTTPLLPPTRLPVHAFPHTHTARTFPLRPLPAHSYHVPICITFTYCRTPWLPCLPLPAILARGRAATGLPRTASCCHMGQVVVLPVTAHMSLHTTHATTSPPHMPACIPTFPHLPHGACPHCHPSYLPLFAAWFSGWGHTHAGPSWTAVPDYSDTPTIHISLTLPPSLDIPGAFLASLDASTRMVVCWFCSLSIPSGFPNYCTSYWASMLANDDTTTTAPAHATYHTTHMPHPTTHCFYPSQHPHTLPFHRFYHTHTYITHSPCCSQNTRPRLAWLCRRVPGSQAAWTLHFPHIPTAPGQPHAGGHPAFPLASTTPAFSPSLQHFTMASSSLVPPFLPPTIPVTYINFRLTCCSAARHVLPATLAPTCPHPSQPHSSWVLSTTFHLPSHLRWRWLHQHLFLYHSLCILYIASLCAACLALCFGRDCAACLWRQQTPQNTGARAYSLRARAYRNPTAFQQRFTHHTHALPPPGRGAMSLMNGRLCGGTHYGDRSSTPDAAVPRRLLFRHSSMRYLNGGVTAGSRACQFRFGSPARFYHPLTCAVHTPTQLSFTAAPACTCAPYAISMPYRATFCR